ncbi:MAG: ketoacid CoA transferase [Gammaproteobacteria bacterium]
MKDSNIADICISQAARAWADDGEILATGIGLIPRLAASLSKIVFNEGLMITDGETYLIDEPFPLGVERELKIEGYMSYSRVFENLWGGSRHAMVTPTQIDQFAQMNISCIGDYASPKVQLLGSRGFPGNSISHKNSVFIPAHTLKSFVEGEVDMVSSIGFKKENKYQPQIGKVFTNLGVFDFNGDNNSFRLISIHPDVDLASIEQSTGFQVDVSNYVETELPSSREIEIIEYLDPKGMRFSVFGG